MILLMETKEFRIDFICFLAIHSSRFIVSEFLLATYFVKAVNGSCKSVRSVAKFTNLAMTLANHKFVHNEIGSKLR